MPGVDSTSLGSCLCLQLCQKMSASGSKRSSNQLKLDSWIRPKRRALDLQDEAEPSSLPSQPDAADDDSDDMNLELSSSPLALADKAQEDEWPDATTHTVDDDNPVDETVLSGSSLNLSIGSQLVESANIDSDD